MGSGVGGAGGCARVMEGGDWCTDESVSLTAGGVLLTDCFDWMCCCGCCWSPPGRMVVGVRTGASVVESGVVVVVLLLLSPSVSSQCVWLLGHSQAACGPLHQLPFGNLFGHLP